MLKLPNFGATSKQLLRCLFLPLQRGLQQKQRQANTTAASFFERPDNRYRRQNTSMCAMCALACGPHFVHYVTARPPSAPRRSAVAVDEDDEDAPAVVDDVDLDDEDNANVQHGSLRAAFPMAFGNGQL